MNKFQEELRKRTFGYITTAFGLVAGLAWNEAIKALIERFFPMGDGGMIAKFTYAVIITTILVIVSVYILKTDKDKAGAEKTKN